MVGDPNTFEDIQKTGLNSNNAALLEQLGPVATKILREDIPLMYEDEQTQAKINFQNSQANIFTSNGDPIGNTKQYAQNLNGEGSSFEGSVLANTGNMGDGLTNEERQRKKDEEHALKLMLTTSDMSPTELDKFAGMVFEHCDRFLTEATETLDKAETLSEKIQDKLMEAGAKVQAADDKVTELETELKKELAGEADPEKLEQLEKDIKETKDKSKAGQKEFDKHVNPLNEIGEKSRIIEEKIEELKTTKKQMEHDAKNLPEDSEERKKIETELRRLEGKITQAENNELKDLNETTDKVKKEYNEPLKDADAEATVTKVAETDIQTPALNMNVTLDERVAAMVTGDTIALEDLDRLGDLPPEMQTKIAEIIDSNNITVDMRNASPEMIAKFKPFMDQVEQNGVTTDYGVKTAKYDGIDELGAIRKDAENTPEPAPGQDPKLEELKIAQNALDSKETLNNDDSAPAASPGPGPGQ